MSTTGYFPTNIHLSRSIPKESVRIETCCCIFKRVIIDWTNTKVTGISGIRIELLPLPGSAQCNSIIFVIISKE